MERTAAKKACVFLLLAAFVFAFAMEAAAVRQRFGQIEAEVPAGWTAEESEEQLTFMAPDKSAALTIMVGDLEGYTLQAVAVGMSRELSGGTPEAVDCGFFFNFLNEYGVDCQALVTGDEEAGFYMIWIQFGEHPYMDALLESVEWID